MSASNRPASNPRQVHCFQLARRDRRVSIEVDIRSSVDEGRLRVNPLHFESDVLFTEDWYFTTFRTDRGMAQLGFWDCCLLARRTRMLGLAEDTKRAGPRNHGLG